MAIRQCTLVYANHTTYVSSVVDLFKQFRSMNRQMQTGSVIKFLSGYRSSLVCGLEGTHDDLSGVFHGFRMRNTPPIQQWLQFVGGCYCLPYFCQSGH